MITLCPEFNRFLTIPDPIFPKPMNPNLNLDGMIFFSNKALDIVVISNEGST